MSVARSRRAAILFTMLSGPAPLPSRISLTGSSVDVVPLDAAQHGDALFEGAKGHDELWTYLFEGPFHDRPSFDEATRRMTKSDDPLFYAIVDKASGLA